MPVEGATRAPIIGVYEVIQNSVGSCQLAKEIFCPHMGGDSVKALPIKDAIKGGQKYLEGEGLSQAKNEVFLFLSQITGLSPMVLFLENDRFLTKAEVEMLEGWLQRRAFHEPIQYILKDQPFWEGDFLVSAGVFIPRPETEFIIEEVMKRSLHPKVALDLCTGGGCLAISLSRANSKVKFYAVDFSYKALDVAKKNAQRFKVENQIQFLEGDLFTPLEGEGLENQADLIVTNPPYIPSKDFWGLPYEIRDFEPPLAFLGGEEGVEVIERILKRAGDFLKPDGIMLMEIGNGQKNRIKRIIQEEARDLFLSKTVCDFNGIERVLCFHKVNDSRVRIEGY